MSYDIKKRADRLVYVLNKALFFSKIKGEELKLVEDNLELAYEQGKLDGVMAAKEAMK